MRHDEVHQQPPLAGTAANVPALPLVRDEEANLSQRARDMRGMTLGRRSRDQAFAQARWLPSECAQPVLKTASGSREAYGWEPRWEAHG